jgi:hypothetical protein
MPCFMNIKVIGVYFQGVLPTWAEICKMTGYRRDVWRDSLAEAFQPLSHALGISPAGDSRRRRDRPRATPSQRRMSGEIADPLGSARPTVTRTDRNALPLLPAISSAGQSRAVQRPGQRPVMDRHAVYTVSGSSRSNAPSA